MSDRSDDQHDEEADPPATDVDAGLGDLRDRLGDLQQRVELLGSQGVWPEPTPPAQSGYEQGYPGYDDPATPPPAPGPYPAPGGWQEPAPGAWPQPIPPQPPTEPGHGYPPPPPGEPLPPPATPDPYGYQPPPAAPEPVWQQPPTEPIPAAAPTPVATNGHSKDPAEVSARSTSVALVDAGPFDDLIQLRHFEDELASLNAVRDVRVRRFGHGRASIEVGMTGPYSLDRELFRIGREMSIAAGAAGDLIVDLAPIPPAPEETEPVADGAEEPPL